MKGNVHNIAKPMPVRDIQARVAEHFGITMKDMLGPGQARAFSWPRQVAMYLARRLTNLSWPELGRMFGRDHGTVISGADNVVWFMRHDMLRCACVQLIETRLLERTPTGAKILDPRQPDLL